MDAKFPSLDFSKVTGLSKFQTLVAADPEDVFMVPKADANAAPDAPRTGKQILTSPPAFVTEGQCELAVATPIITTNKTTK